MSKTLIRDGVVYYERVFVDNLKAQLKAKEEEYKELELWFAETLQSEHNGTIKEALEYIREEMKRPTSE